MSESDTRHQAIVRLYELVRSGDVDNLEFSQLDSLVYGGLEKTYQVNDDAHGGRAVRSTTF